MFQLGKVHTGDCVELMQQLPDNYIDLTVTSPPYDNLRKYNGYSFNFENTATQLYRITKPGGVVVWVVGDATVKGSETGTSFKQALYFMQCGFNLHDTMIFKKKNPIPQIANGRYKNEFEYMFVFTKETIKCFNPLRTKCIHAGKVLSDSTTYKDFNRGKQKRNKKAKPVKEEKNLTNIWEYVVGQDPIGKKHPAHYPEKLAEDHILSWSNPDDLIFDPFSGSGTTGKMAMLNNRKFLGFEISEEYTQLANTRIKNTVFDGL